MKKEIQIKSWEWLSKTGDNKKLLIRFSIINDSKSLNKQDEREKDQVIIVVISRNRINEIKNNKSRLTILSRLEQECLQFAIEEIKKRIKDGKEFAYEEEIILVMNQKNFSFNFEQAPILPNHKVVIEVIGKLGFITD